VQRLTDDAARAAADVTEQRARADAGHQQASDASRARRDDRRTGRCPAMRRDERAHTQIRLTDQRAGYEDRLTELRAEIDKDKTQAQNPRRGNPRAAAH